MTTFQDPQPQSRRAVRQSERGENPETPANFSEQPALAPQFYSDQAAPRETWENPSRRASQTPSSAPRDGSATPTGRRAAAPATQQEQDALPPTQALPQVEEQGYRVREFRPVRSTSTSAFDWHAPLTSPPSDLDHQSEGNDLTAPVFSAPIFSAPIAAVPADIAPAAPEAPTAFVPPVVSAVPDAPALTRRELRAREQAAAEQSLLSQQPAAEAPAATGAPVDEAPVAPAEAAVEQSSAAEQVPAEQAPAEELSPFDALFRSPSEQSAPVAAAPVVAEQASAEQASAQQPEAPAEPADVPEQLTAVPAQPTEAPAELIEPPVHSRLAPEPAASAALNDAVTEYDLLAPKVTPSSEPFSWSPPVGHWSTQAETDDEFSENNVSRTIGSGTVTTNALVLPGIPMGNDIRGPLTGTGEIMLTGSIDLPHTFSATGQSDRFDDDGIDALFDLNDAEIISTDSAPVRAIRAVSTHTSGHGVTHTQKPKGTRALTALLIAASSMAVVVAGLLVAAFAFNVF